MTQLIRESLKELISNSSSAHAGLLLTRGLSEHESAKQKLHKEALIERTTNIGTSDLYQHAFKRWHGLTSQAINFCHFTATLSGRLMMGLSTGGAIETGISTHHTYGMPMIAGSSVKGVARAYAESINLDPQYQAVLFGVDEQLASISGQREGAGCLVWHDAWWIPDGSKKPFVEEVVTVHHQGYYAGTEPATDFDNPTPNQQLAVQGSFYFVIEGDPNWLGLAMKLLLDALGQQGIGAKRAAGYGFMTENSQLKQKIHKQQQEAQEKAKKDQEIAILKEQMATMTENQKQLMEFKIKLSVNALWQNGNAGMDNMGFASLYKTVEQWTEAADIKAAIDLLVVELEKWLKKPIKDNKNWKEKVNSLKRKIGLLP
jgi:CRISPR-associated protein Cmr6